MTYSANQVAHFYVLNGGAKAGGTNEAKRANLVNIGDWAVCEGNNGKKWIEVMQAGGVVRTPLFDTVTKNVDWANYKPAKESRRALRYADIKLRDLEGAKGEQVGLTFHFYGWTFHSPADYHIASVDLLVEDSAAETEITVGKKLVYALVKGLTGTLANSFEVRICDTEGEAGTVVKPEDYFGIDKDTAINKVAYTAGDIIRIVEKESSYVRGKMDDQAAPFQITAWRTNSAKPKDGWVNIKQNQFKKDLYYVKNGREFAEMEWFMLGERGDMIRFQDWRRAFDTEYIIDPKKEYCVSTVGMHYTDVGIHTYNSDFTITFVFEDTNGDTGVNTDIKTLVDSAAKKTSWFDKQ